MEDPTKRRYHQWLFGHIISAAGERKYLVRFDDGTEKECPSAVLREERVAASLPPDVQVPITSTQVEAMEAITSTQVEAMEAEDVQEEIADQDVEAELPDLPEVEDEEAAAEEQAGEEEAKEVVEEVAAAGDSAGMIGQFPTENEVANNTSGRIMLQLKS
jgi:hypothetical protein